MSVSRHPSIRALLRSNEDGLTVTQIARFVNADEDPIRLALKAMPDTYIDRWTKGRDVRGQWEAVWCAVVPPDDCPKPSDVESSA